jgi:hypothetical protein
MTNLKKNKLQDAMNAVREVFYDSIECRIRYSGNSYAAIASELGCSEQLVFQVAKLRGLGRNSQQTTSTEVSDE